MLWIGLAFVLVLALSGFIELRRRATALTARLRAQWGKSEGAPLDPESIEDIAEYWRQRQQWKAPTVPVDDTTWADLDLDTIFARLCAAQSGVGEEALYAMLRDTGMPEQALRERAERIEYFLSHATERVAVQTALARVGRQRFHRAVSYLFAPTYRRPRHAGLYITLGSLPIALAIGALFVPALWLALAAVFVCNLVVYYRSHSIWGMEETAIRHLSKVLLCAQRLAELDLPGLQEDQEMFRAFSRTLRPVKRWMQWFCMQRQSDLDFVTDYAKILFQVNMVGLCRITAYLHKHGNALAALYERVGEWDACIALASLRASGAQVCAPRFHEALELTVEGLTHPLVHGAVPNDMHWNRNALVTGSNASGKSTFLKAMAINCILAQTVTFAFAGALVMPRGRVMSSMAIRDNVLGGESYFIAELKSLRRVLEAIEQGTPVLCFIDEILRGTNTIERIAASCALLRYLSGRPALCMAATHDIELTRLLAKEYDQYHFQEEITETGMVFPYQLLEGPSSSRNAILLLEQMRFPAAIVKAAQAQAAREDNAAEP